MALSNSRKNSIAICIGLLIAIGIFETFGRLAPVTTGFRAGMSYLRFHPQLGFELDPNVGSFSYDLPCLSIPRVSIDSKGNRSSSADSTDPSNNDALRIAVLGDSFMMGREVANDENISAILSRAITNSAVVNFGVPGYGTIQAYLTYVLKASRLKPDITVLGFLDVNDVIENSAYLGRNDSLSNVRPFFAEDQKTILPPRNKSLTDNQPGSLLRTTHQFLKEHSFTYYMAYKYGATILKGIAGKRSSTANSAENYASDKRSKPEQSMASTQANVTEEYWWQRQGLFGFLAMYQQDPDKPLELAWQTTEKTLLLLRDAITRDGGHFVLMLIPAQNSSWIPTTLKNYEQQFGDAAPPRFDVRYPAERLIRFAKINNIDVLDLGPIFAAYRDQHALSDPYFHFRCDGHWSPLGHYIAAHSLAEHLEQQGILADGQHNIDTFMDRSPQELLGTTAVDSIFGWGKTYRGDSNLTQN